jgi:hypothetical protein
MACPRGQAPIVIAPKSHPNQMKAPEKSAQKETICVK